MGSRKGEDDKVQLHCPDGQDIQPVPNAEKTAAKNKNLEEQRTKKLNSTKVWSTT